jgi:hypothetical protein
MPFEMPPVKNEAGTGTPDLGPTGRLAEPDPTTVCSEPQPESGGGAFARRRIRGAAFSGSSSTFSASAT